DMVALLGRAEGDGSGSGGFGLGCSHDAPNVVRPARLGNGRALGCVDRGFLIRSSPLSSLRIFHNSDLILRSPSEARASRRMAASPNLLPWFETARCARLLTMRPSVWSSCQIAKIERFTAPCAGTTRSATCPFLVAQSHAAAAATRAGAGFSMIGRLISAESTPSRIESHHTTS